MIAPYEYTDSLNQRQIWEPYLTGRERQEFDSHLRVSKTFFFFFFFSCLSFNVSKAFMAQSRSASLRLRPVPISQGDPNLAGLQFRNLSVSSQSSTSSAGGGGTLSTNNNASSSGSGASKKRNSSVSSTSSAAGKAAANVQSRSAGTSPTSSTGGGYPKVNAADLTALEDHHQQSRRDSAGSYHRNSYASTARQEAYALTSPLQSIPQQQQQQPQQQQQQQQQINYYYAPTGAATAYDTAGAATMHFQAHQDATGASTGASASGSVSGNGTAAQYNGMGYYYTTPYQGNGSGSGSGGPYEQ